MRIVDKLITTERCMPIIKHHNKAPISEKGSCYMLNTSNLCASPHFFVITRLLALFSSSVLVSSTDGEPDFFYADDIHVFENDSVIEQKPIFWHLLFLVYHNAYQVSSESFVFTSIIMFLFLWVLVPTKDLAC